MPQFSIIITSHNQDRFIKDAVDSAISQRSLSKEVIVVDDASSDGSVKTLEEYGDKIRLIKKEQNKGPSAARNSGASAAKGEYLVFLDGDDLLLPWALDVYARLIELKKPKVILCRLLFFRGLVPTPQIGEFGRTVEIVEYEALILKDRVYRCSASAIVVGHGAFEATGGWAEDLFTSEIEDLTIKLGFSGCTVQILSHPTTAYRVHESNVVHLVERFVDSTKSLIEKEKRGEYPGGKRGKYARYSYIGGPVFFWIKRNLQAGRYWGSLRLLASGWQTILLAIWSKILLKLKGRRPSESIQM